MREVMGIPLPSFASEDKDRYRSSPYQYEVTSPLEQWTIRYGKADVLETAITYGSAECPDQAADTAGQPHIILHG